LSSFAFHMTGAQCELPAIAPRASAEPTPATVAGVPPAHVVTSTALSPQGVLFSKVVRENAQMVVLMTERFAGMMEAAVQLVRAADATAGLRRRAAELRRAAAATTEAA
jgi:hypothetical protein